MIAQFTLLFSTVLLFFHLLMLLRVNLIYKKTVTIDSHVSNSTICLISALDNGESYYEVRKNTSASTFSNVSKPYLVTITKQNYIPYMKDPDNILYKMKRLLLKNIYKAFTLKQEKK